MADCRGCTLCCRHVSVEVDEPGSEDELDEYIWLVLHENVRAYVDEGKWYVEFITKCRMLQDDGTCGIYDSRPSVCSGYDPSDCLRSGDEPWYDELFETPEQLRAYWLREHG